MARGARMGLRRVVGLSLALIGLALALYVPWSYWRVGGQMLDELTLPDGYEVVDSHRRTLSLVTDDMNDLATVVVRREPTGDLDEIRRDLVDHLMTTHGYGADGAAEVDGERYYYRARNDSYDADMVRVTRMGDDVVGDAVVVGFTVFDTDGLMLVPAGLAVGTVVVLIGVALATRRVDGRPVREPDQARPLSAR